MSFIKQQVKGWRNAGWLTAVFALGFLATSYVVNQQVKFSAKYFVADYTTTVEGRAQLYHNTGKGFNESQMVSTTIKPSRHSKRVSLPLLRETIVGLRFDPRKETGSLQVSSFFLEDALGFKRQEFPLEATRVINATKRVRSAQVLKLNMRPGQNDPMVVIPLQSPIKVNWRLNHPITLAFLWARGLVVFSLSFGFLWLVAPYRFRLLLFLHRAWLKLKDVFVTPEEWSD